MRSLRRWVHVQRFEFWTHWIEILRLFSFQVSESQAWADTMESSRSRLSVTIEPSSSHPSGATFWHSKPSFESISNLNRLSWDVYCLPNVKLQIPAILGSEHQQGDHGFVRNGQMHHFVNRSEWAAVSILNHEIKHLPRDRSYHTAIQIRLKLSWPVFCFRLKMRLCVFYHWIKSAETWHKTLIWPWS